MEIMYRLSPKGSLEMISYDTLLPQAKSLKHTAFYICPTQALSIFNEFLLKANQQTRQNRIQTWRRLAVPSRSLQSKYQLLSDSSHTYTCIMLLSSTPTPLWGLHWSPFTSWCFPFLCSPCPPWPHLPRPRKSLLESAAAFNPGNSGQCGIGWGRYLMPANSIL